MGIKKYGLLLGILGILAILASFLISRVPENSPKPTAAEEYDVQWTTTTLVGRREGVKQWEMELGNMTQEEQLVNLLEIEQVTIFDENEPAYLVDAQTGVWDRKSNDLELFGEIVITGPDGFEMYTDRVIWNAKDEELEAPNWVEMQFSDSDITADRMVSYVKQDEVHLLGNVVIEEGKQRWQLEQLIYDTKDDVMHIVGPGLIQFGGNQSGEGENNGENNN